MTAQPIKLHAVTHLPGGSDELFKGVLTSLNYLGSLQPALTGDVLLEGGINIDMVIPGLGVNEMRIDNQWDMLITTNSTINPNIDSVTYPTKIDGGIDYRGWIWSFDSVVDPASGLWHRDFSSFDNILPWLDLPGLSLGSGLYLVFASAEITFPAQAEPRAGQLVIEPEGDNVFFLLGSVGKRYMEMGNTLDRVETFQLVSLIYLPAGRNIMPVFYEDDAGFTRDGTTLSSAQTLKLTIITPRYGI